MSLHNEKIVLQSIYTDEVRPLKARFVSSFLDDWEVNIEHWGTIGEGGGNFATRGYVELLRRRTNFLIDLIKERSGQILVWSDVDIQFFGRCEPFIRSALRSADLAFLAEDPARSEVSGGFVAIRCNASTQSFYAAVAATPFENLPFYDQSAVSQLLRSGQPAVSWTMLPGQFWAMSHLGPPPADIVLHHANCTRPFKRWGRPIGSIEAKLRQMDYVRRRTELRRNWPRLFGLRDDVASLLPSEGRRKARMLLWRGW